MPIFLEIFSLRELLPLPVTLCAARGALRHRLEFSQLAAPSRLLVQAEIHVNPHVGRGKDGGFQAQPAELGWQRRLPFEQPRRQKRHRFTRYARGNQHVQVQRSGAISARPSPVPVACRALVAPVHFEFALSVRLPGREMESKIIWTAPAPEQLRSDLYKHGSGGRDLGAVVRYNCVIRTTVSG